MQIIPNQMSIYSTDVLCPECEITILRVNDIRFGNNNDFVERYISCPLCRASNSLRLYRPEHPDAQ
jgi:rubredoxin